MKLPEQTSPWQPMTFGGVAAFATGTTARLLKVQLLMGLVASGCLVWFVASAWFAGLDAAIDRLPEQSAIRNGRLEWDPSAPPRLIEGPFLSITVNASGDANIGTPADLQLILGTESFRLQSIFGHWQLPYPRGWTLSLARSEVKPWWRARQPFLLAAGLAVGLLGLLLSWWLLAVTYAFPVRWIASAARRELTFAGSWRIAGASLLPGVLLMSVAVVSYGLHRLPLPGLLLAWVLHLLIGWVYAAVAPLCLPRRAVPPSAVGNPFRDEETPARGGPEEPNPFRRDRG